MKISINNPYFLLDHSEKLSVETKKLHEDSWELRFIQSPTFAYAKSFTVQARTHHLHEIIDALNGILKNSQ